MFYTLGVRDYLEACYSQIIPGLYLSNAKSASDIHALGELGITHVLTIDSQRLPRYVFMGTHISTLFIRAADSPETQLLPYFPMANSFIERALHNQGGKVLVHCHRGISRSPTLVIAFLMNRYKYTFERAYNYVERRRRFINPNPGFVEQLKMYQQLGYDVRGYGQPEADTSSNILRKYKIPAVLFGIIVLVVLFLLPSLNQEKIEE